MGTPRGVALSLETSRWFGKAARQDMSLAWVDSERGEKGRSWIMRGLG